MATASKKKTSKKSTAKKKDGPKKTIVSFKDIAMHYMMGGLDAVKRLDKKMKDNPANDGDGLSSKTLWGALDEMEGSTIDVTELRAYTIENHGEPSEGRGRTNPVVGESRTYKAQKLEKGDCFLRLPLGALNVEKGQGVFP